MKIIGNLIINFFDFAKIIGGLYDPAMGVSPYDKYSIC